MGVHILKGEESKAVFFCSTTGWAFGPVFESWEEADGFQKWLLKDARLYLDSELAEKHAEFRRRYVCECGNVADGGIAPEEDEVEPAYGYPTTGKERFTCYNCDDPRHRAGCICADCSGAELTAEND